MKSRMTILTILMSIMLALPIDAAMPPPPPPPPPAAGDMYNSMNAVSTSYAFLAGASFRQRFRSNISTYPTELAVQMGSNQRPYNALVVVQVNDAEVFRHKYYNLVQRSSDWATVFPVRQLNRQVNAGDYVTFIVTVDSDTGIAAAQLNDPYNPPQPLGNSSSNINARFYFRGNTQPDTSAYNDIPDPAIIRTTMGNSADWYALRAWAPFTETVQAIGSGIPTEFAILMGNNQNPYTTQLKITVNGVTAFDQTFTGRVQRTSDWATVYPLTGFSRSINPGDIVAFTVTNDQQVGFAVVFINEVGVTKGTLPGYGTYGAKLYLKR